MNSKARFGNRVENYVRYRPDYPNALFEELHNQGVISSTSSWWDTGAGTGIWTAQLAPWVERVYATEPNEAMRKAAEEFLRNQSNVTLGEGAAEASGLPAKSVHGVSAAQAFHWFDPLAFRAECQRVLHPGGLVLLVWNDRSPSANAFLEDYEQILLTHAVDYREVNHRNVTSEALAGFYGANGFVSSCHPHVQSFDWDGFLGRVMSSSYAPAPGHPGHETMLEALRNCFATHVTQGRVRFEYSTRAYWGSLEAD